MPINLKNLDIDLPTGKLPMEDYAAMVRKVELHLLDLKTERDRIEVLANIHKAELKKHAHGSNKDERENALKILLDADQPYKQMSDELSTLDWQINKYKAEQSYYERMFRAAEVRQEQITQAAALFKTFPGDIG